MTVSADTVRQLRAATGAGVMDAKRALAQAGGDLTKAVDLLRQQGRQVLAQKAGRTSKEGVLEAYVHPNRKLAVLVEVRCETDFVARNEDFRAFAHELALQVAAANPLYVGPADVPPDVVAKEREIAAAQLSGLAAAVAERAVAGKLEKFYAQACLLKQPSVRDDTKTVEQLLTSLVAKLGENVQVTRFVRLALEE